jgi:lipopolysaccharide/colanic/teichoic acid biosynthesis glycosyltransferase
LIFSSELGQNPKFVVFQFIYSAAIAFAGAILAAPVMLLVAILLKLTSRGPVFYGQQRIGKDGVPFTLYKFRSMIHHAESRSGAVWASKDDPHTPVGKLLRNLRLEELPQLFNVLKGEMSIVGPAPN